MRLLEGRRGRFESAASIILFMLDLRIQQHFIDSADLQYQAAETLAKPLDAGVQALMACVTSGGKVLVCGEGSAAALAQYFASLFVGGFGGRKHHPRHLLRVSAPTSAPSANLLNCE